MKNSGISKLGAKIGIWVVVLGMFSCSKSKSETVPTPTDISGTTVNTSVKYSEVIGTSHVAQKYYLLRTI